MTVALSDADRFARARLEFVEAMAAGCSILELRRRKAATRASLRHRAQQAVSDRTNEINGRQGHFIVDEAAQFGLWSSPWMLRD